jgi:protein-L-isoaspartate(D-aspartate) O-methyltransferase
MNDNELNNALKNMVDEQIVDRGISEKRLINALLSVLRHQFIPDAHKQLAYSDQPLPIGFGQTISQPYIVALMISELKLMGNEHILEIGTGCGYQTAVLAQMVADVISIEIIPELARSATQTISQQGIKNVRVIISDGSVGWSKSAPYDAILVSAAAPEVPRPLLEQLAEGGRLILPVGSRVFQQLEIWSCRNSTYHKATGIPVAFVPLLGKYGWKS